MCSPSVRCVCTGLHCIDPDFIYHPHTSFVHVTNETLPIRLMLSVGFRACVCVCGAGGGGQLVCSGAFNTKVTLNFLV